MVVYNTGMGGEPESGRLSNPVVDWPACGAGDGAGCTGTRVGSHGRCWAHLTREELRQALGSLSPGDDLDVRGTSLSRRLLDRILGALRDPQTGSPHIGAARFSGARFGGDVSFDHARFGGAVSFGSAEFGGAVSFDHARFGGDVSFSGGPAWFGGDVSFDHAEFGGGAQFSGARFGGTVSFDHAEFGGDGAWFGGVKFSGGPAWFGGARFGGDAWFGEAEFGGGAASFDHAEFSGDKVSFDHAEFGGGAASFDHVKFGGGTVSFDHATFSFYARFDDAEFGGGASFDHAEFRGHAAFVRVRAEGGLSVGPSVVGGTLILRAVRAGGVVRVAVAAKRLECADGEFGGRVWLSLWGGEAWVTDSVFAEPVTVESSLEPIGPSAPGQAAQVPGSRSRVVLRSLRGTDAEHLTLVDVDLGRCVLSGLRRPESLRLDGRCVFARTPHGWWVRWRWVPWRWMGREALFEEQVWRQSVGAPGWTVPGGQASAEGGGADGGGAGGVVGPARLAVLYRQLRVAVESAKNEPGASALYYGEMEMRRLAAGRQLGLVNERWLLGAYWLVSGYGLRARRALGWLAVLVVVAAVGLGHGGFAGGSPGFAGCVLYAAGSVVSLDVLIRHVPAVLTEWGDVVRLALRVGGPVLLGLAALAVRAQVKR